MGDTMNDADWAKRFIDDYRNAYAAGLAAGFGTAEAPIVAKAGDKLCGLELVRKSVENGAFGWWLSSGGFISVANLIAIAKLGPK